ncbi:MAG: hypothetical protein O4805_18040 [Trichodesmium sp. St16_bin2-tuft]|jgi:hypothetical protein|nr:hypothetical protein [Trichodesmium sp. St18_bin1]MDE5088919.1 hypothetical protein [Trichodesmium sp. St16_bin2-tuft]MDE5108268.1 hypothetical protein [Trichodesmium sp. St17_bin3_1_1]MDE5123433.1 hypothetical protein [Trichodesmium sp. St19_bin1]
MFRKLIFIGSIIAVFLSIIGCSSSRMAQCSQLIVIIKKGHAIMETNISYEAATTYKLGGELKEIAQELQALELKDKNLQQFQNNFYKTFIEFSDAFIDMSLGLKTMTQVEASLIGRNKFNQAKTRITQAGKQVNQVAIYEDILVEKLVSYCQNN